MSGPSAARPSPKITAYRAFNHAAAILKAGASAEDLLESARALEVIAEHITGLNSPLWAVFLDTAERRRIRGELPRVTSPGWSETDKNFKHFCNLARLYWIFNASAGRGDNPFKRGDLHARLVVAKYYRAGLSVSATVAALQENTNRPETVGGKLAKGRAVNELGR